jgi:hypothetical protein
LLKNAEVAHTLRERGTEFGFSLENLQLDYGAAALDIKPDDGKWYRVI